MVKPAINDDVLRYLGCMDRVNGHLRTIEGLHARSFQQGLDCLTEELIWLHRKAFEELRLLVPSANVDVYSENP